jgi:general secretion pathway protein I
MTNPGREDGFTLLEVVVAIAILSFSLAVLYPAFGKSAIRLDATSKRAYGLSLAEARLSSVLVSEDWSGLPRAGEDNGWQWQVEGERYAHASDGETATGFLYKVTVTATPPRPGLGGPLVLERIVFRRS